MGILGALLRKSCQLYVQTSILLIVEEKLATLGKLTFWLQQTQLAGACYGFCSPLDLQLAVDIPIVPFDGT